MLERLQIQNFQNHEKLKVRFDPEITAITGPTDAGKSAILRAIRWVVENRPLGDGFVRIGSNGPTFSSLWANGTRVKRLKDGTRANTYQVGPVKMEAFGTAVPEEVGKALNLGPVNFQDQIDPPFWFTLSPGEVAKQINSIVDLECIDRAVAEAKSRVRKTAVEVEVIESRLSEIDDELESLSFIEAADEAYSAVEELEEKLGSIQVDKEEVEQHVAEWDKWDKRVQGMTSLLEDFSEVGRFHGELVSLFEQIIDLEELIEEADQEVVVPDFSLVAQRHEELEDVRAELKELRKWVLEATVQETMLEELELKYKELEAELAERFDVCPLCERKM